MKRLEISLRFMFAFSILSLVACIPQIASSNTLNQKVFINTSTINLPASKACNDAKASPTVGMVARSVSKNDAQAKNIGPRSIADIQNLYRCAPDDLTNPGCSNIFGWHPLDNATAYYRDVVLSVRANISNPADRETFGVIFTRPDGSTFGGGTATFYNNFNGRANCFEFSDGSELCNFDGLLINDFFFISQCKPTGQWRADLVKGLLGDPLVSVANSQFTLAPEIGTPLMKFNQADYLQQYGNFCHDPGSHVQYVCDPQVHPGEEVTSILTEGCTITALSTALRYYNVQATPDDLNAYLTNNGGYNAISGEINLGIIPAYAIAKGVPGNIDNVMRLAPPSDLFTNICSFGPILARVKNNTHMVTAFGFELNQFGVGDPKIIDPNGGFENLLTPVIYGGIDYLVRIVGREYTFTRRSMSFQFYSPVQVFITDPQGRRKGIDVRTNTTYNEIPNSFYGEAGTLGPDLDSSYHPPKVLEISGPVEGEYTLTVIGTDTGTYRSSFAGYDDNANQSITYLPSIPTSPGLVHTYKITYAGAVGSQLQIAANFDGGGQRPRDVNKFLTYVNPTASSTSLPAGTTSFPLLIIYNKNIIPTSFKADLNGTDITSMFKPTAGNIESVNIPLQSGSNVLKLSVDGNLSNRVATDSDRLVFKVP